MFICHLSFWEREPRVFAVTTDAVMILAKSWFSFRIATNISLFSATVLDRILSQTDVSFSSF